MTHHPLDATGALISSAPDKAEGKKQHRAKPTGLKRIWLENGLSFVLIALFIGTWFGQSFTGMREYNQEQAQHGQPQVGYGEYLRSGHFLEATGENWESEFLQMGMFVMLTVGLYQKGSAESKDPYEEDEVDEDPAKREMTDDTPWPVRRGGVWMKLYSNSLAITFFALFVLSFLLHAAGGAREYSSEQLEHGQPGVTMVQYMGTATFWHESLQNWQSEFLSLGAMVLLTVWLRQHGSAESKHVADPHGKTGR